MECEELQTIRVGGVPEHFNYPWTYAIKNGIFERRGVKVDFKFVQGGTGAMVSLLKQNEVDMIVALTEGLVADISKGSDLRLLGTYVESPLCWAISAGPSSGITSVEDLKGKTFGISRFGSGSHLMAIVLALQRGWSVTDLKFVVKNDFDTLRKAVCDGSADAFMWETFMTKPWHDSGELKRVGDITTPWPCFMMASSRKTLDTHLDAFEAVLDGIREACRLFSRDKTMVQQIADAFQLKVEDAAEWYHSHTITASACVSEASLFRVVDALRSGGQLHHSVVVAQLLEPRLARLNKDIKSMRLYSSPELVQFVFNNLQARGQSSGRIAYTDLLDFDQHHYYGVASVESVIHALDIMPDSRVLNIGSGLGGPARLLAGKVGCEVLAVEIQHDLHSTAVELTERCGLSRLAHFVCADFLAVAPHLGDAGYSHIVSWLTILHIPNRTQLFRECFRLLRPGGRFFCDDFYEEGALNSDEWRILRDDVFCFFLPSLAQYTSDLVDAGFRIVTIDVKTRDWRQYTAQRVEQFRVQADSLRGLHGEGVYNGLLFFYTRIADLFAGGNLGGVRIVAEKPS